METHTGVILNIRILTINQKELKDDQTIEMKAALGATEVQD